MEFLITWSIRFLVWLSLFCFCKNAAEGEEYSSVMSCLFAPFGIPVSGTISGIVVALCLVLRIIFGVPVAAAAAVILLIQLKITYAVLKKEAA